MIGLVVCFLLDMPPLSAPVLCALRHAEVKQVTTLCFHLDWEEVSGCEEKNLAWKQIDWSGFQVRKFEAFHLIHFSTNRAGPIIVF